MEGASHGAERRELESAAARADWVAVLTLLNAHWSQLVDDPGFVHGILADVPPAVLRQNPRWVTALGYLEHMLRGTDAVAFRNVTPDFGAGDVLDRLSHLTARLADNRARGDVTEALAGVDAARLALQQSDSGARTALQYALPHLLIQWARVYELAEQEGDAHALLQESFDVAETIEDPTSARNAAGRMAWLDAVSGRHAAAQRWATVAEQRPGTVARYDAGLLLAQALRVADGLDVDAAKSLLDDIPDDRLHQESWASFEFVRAHASTTATAPAALDDLLASESTRPRAVSGAGSNLTLLTHAKVRLRLLLGDAGGALHDTRDLPDHPGLLVARSAALLAADENKAVLALVQRLRPRVAAHPRWRLKLAAVEGVAYARSGSTDAARQIASTVVEAVPRLGLYSSLTLLSADDIHHLLAPIADEAAPILDRVLAHLSPRVVVRLSLLTPREREVLRHMVAGDGVDQIAAKLFVSRHTVKSQMASMYKKLQVTSRDQVLALARTLPLDP